MHVLFVCTGNICRSPLAERLAVAYATRLAIPHFSASSAGVRAVVGHPIHPDAAVVIQHLGGDSSDFSARLLKAKIACEADLILTMTKAHREAVLELVPRQLHKTFTLSSAARLVSDLGARTVDDLAALHPQLAANPGLDIPDPMGKSADFHARVGSQIASFLPPILKLWQPA
ncbi:low molecular weight phosphatase family protein [Mycolicibacterium elephantis]|uniref:Low molecular weight phosphatase family protein n=1 Tax=Mycolicibacterium elephantis TaxID=81858 RepID=A0A1X0D8M7_9MYCO|nr:low molecular weight phosphatase family protein [Mycolicibacterium elephantis]ORA68764.1 low molecular weight phosphatase family protein [Mycolicibacterium elephantis]